MSTPDPARPKAERPAERALFRALFDDAAVFPPGLAPLPRAVAAHVGRQSSSFADLVGPLLVPASAAEELVTLAPPGLAVALVGRHGTDLTLLGQALSRLDDSDTVTVTGVELGWARDWHRGAIGKAERPRRMLSVEVPRGPDLNEALSDIRLRAEDGDPVQAKFRTGANADQPAPTSTELAIFIRACVDHDLSFKLTGGLHHAISQAASPAGSEDVRPGLLGFLNVIAATRWALAHGAEVPEMESLLSQRDPLPILEIVTRMSTADVSVVRAFFTSYGCCGVMDPIGDLSGLALIRELSV